ncbi:unnamed protein product [Amoebophrya sp. A120]|nr:unnamed protein product [Amoebophrya sp. A120]|eukprot:GSA120T00000039001.1
MGSSTALPDECGGRSPFQGDAPQRPCVDLHNSAGKRNPSSSSFRSRYHEHRAATEVKNSRRGGGIKLCWAGALVVLRNFYCATTTSTLLALVHVQLPRPVFGVTATSPTAANASSTRYFLSESLCKYDQQLENREQCEQAATKLLNWNPSAVNTPSLYIASKEWQPLKTMNRAGCWYDQGTKLLVWKEEGDKRDTSANHGDYLLLCKSEDGGGHGGHHVPALYFLLAFVLVAILGSLLVTALDKFVFHHFLPQSLLLVLVGMLTNVLGHLAPPHGHFAEMIHAVSHIDPHVLFWVLLPFLLYEDGSSADWRVLKPVFSNAVTLAVPGVLISFLLLGGCIKLLFSDPPGDDGWTLESCLLLAVILSATDPVAVVGALKVLGAPARLTLLIAGEALMNDATAVVFFLLFFDIARGVKDFTIGYSLLTFSRLALGGPVIAVVGMLVAYFVLSRVKHIDAQVFLFLIAIIVFGLFFVSEMHEIHVSGVLAVVAFAFWYAAVGKDLIAANGGEHLTHAHHQVVSFLAGVANDFIFFIAGVVMARYIFFSDMRVQDWLELGLLYVLCHCCRGLAILVLLPVLNIGGYSVSLKEALVCVVGGLRGAVGLAMALLVELDQSEDPLPLEIRLRIGFHVSGIALLTLSINGVLFGKIYDKLKIYPPAEQPNQLLMQKSALLAEAVAYEHVTEMRHHWLFSNLDADAVLRLTPRVSDMLEQEAKSTVLEQHEVARSIVTTAFVPTTTGSAATSSASIAELKRQQTFSKAQLAAKRAFEKRRAQAGKVSTMTAARKTLDAKSTAREGAKSVSLLRPKTIVEVVLQQAHDEFHAPEHYESVFATIVKEWEEHSYDYEKWRGLTCFLVPGLDESFIARQAHASNWLTAEYASKSLRTLLTAFLNAVHAGLDRLRKQRYRMGTWPGAQIGEALIFAKEAMEGIVRADPCLKPTAKVIVNYFPDMPPEIWKQSAQTQAEWALEVAFCRLYADIYGAGFDPSEVVDHESSTSSSRYNASPPMTSLSKLKKQEAGARSMLFFCLVLENARALLQPVVSNDYAAEASKRASESRNSGINGRYNDGATRGSIDSRRTAQSTSSGDNSGSAGALVLGGRVFSELFSRKRSGTSTGGSGGASAVAPPPPGKNKISPAEGVDVLDEEELVGGEGTSAPKVDRTSQDRGNLTDNSEENNINSSTIQTEGRHRLPASGLLRQATAKLQEEKETTKIVSETLDLAVEKLDVSLKRVLFAARSCVIKNWIGKYPKVSRVWLHSLAAQGIAEDMWHQLEMCKDSGLLTAQELGLLDANVFHLVLDHLEAYSNLDHLDHILHLDRESSSRAAFEQRGREQAGAEAVGGTSTTSSALKQGTTIPNDAGAASSPVSSAPSTRLSVPTTQHRRTVSKDGGKTEVSTLAGSIRPVQFDFSKDKEQRATVLKMRERVSKSVNNRKSWRGAIQRTRSLIRLGAASTVQATTSGEEELQNENGEEVQTGPTTQEPEAEANPLQAALAEEEEVDEE